MDGAAPRSPQAHHTVNQAASSAAHPTRFAVWAVFRSVGNSSQRGHSAILPPMAVSTASAAMGQDASTTASVHPTISVTQVNTPMPPDVLASTCDSPPQ